MVSSEDIFNEILSRLKQKAKTFPQMLETNNSSCAGFPMHCLECKELCATELWVRLEDVKKELKKLQENHIIIEKKKFKDEIVCGQLSTNAIINDLHERIEEIIKSFVSFKASFIEELLKE